jgi:hypothetical protein
MLRANRLLSLSEQGDEDRAAEFFVERPIPSAPLPEWISGHALSYEMVSDGKVHYTILRDKLYHSVRRITQQLETEETGHPKFGRVLSEVLFDERSYAIGFLFERPHVDKSYARRGPPISIVQGSARFKSEHPNSYEKDGYLWHHVTREWTSAEDMAHSLLKKVRIRGLRAATEKTELSNQVENTLFQYVMQVEDFPLSQRQEFKENMLNHGV